MAGRFRFDFLGNTPALGDGSELERRALIPVNRKQDRGQCPGNRGGNHQRSRQHEGRATSEPGMAPDSVTTDR